jgi:F-type H+-transporting ATPase subunit a
MTPHNLSQATRLLSFTFRLFGALTAGELLRIIVSFIAPLILVIPFYGLEILLVLLQAFVFAGFTLALMVAAESRNDNPASSRG